MVLTAAAFDELSIPITDLYCLYEQSVINDIARRLAKLKFESAAWQMQRLVESGLTYENALEELSKVTGKTLLELRRIFNAAGVHTLQFDDAIYKAAGLKPLPLNLSPAMLNVLLQGLAKTAGVIHNLTMTTALTAQEAFVSAADLAYMQVSTGAMSYGQAIRSAVKNVAQQGLTTIAYPTGHKDQLDVAMRRTVLTGVASTTGTLQLSRAQELGVDLVQTSAHIGARPTHEVWQGKVFSLSGAPGYEDFLTETGYGTVTGLCGINCRHSFYPFFEGLSENAYKAATLQEYADKIVSYNGKTLSVYEATQKQRSIEREIRKTKREAEALGAAGLDNTEELAKVRQLQAKMRDFINQTGLNRQGVREGGRVLKVEVPPVPPKK
ncbi:MAG: hypothetical protein COX14_05195 [Chloroflexi bacterium CG23_combo_of_CG06-09_8_20_14_all_45_10]|nr:MAG: hypothetical protein COX14_05195 [Chloroflexi bacterium CG23_combo_of_CG06-09_8_20_14_all_45_10]